MTFAWPHLLWLLIAPLALLGWELTHRRRTGTASRPKILRAEAGVHSLKLTSFEARPTTPGSLPRVWLCVGFALCIGALARPQWGRIEEPVFDQSREILLAIDLSRSMLAPDVRPSRLDRAKLLIQSLLEKLAGERVGLVVFSGTAFLQSPLSADYEILREFLPALGPEFLPEGGSQYGALLDTALQAFSATTSADRFLVILSDGEATDENWRTGTDEKGREFSRIEELKKKGVRVIGLGVGTAAGAMIPDGTGQFVKDDRGAVVLSKLESGTLQELAQATNGVYRDASAWVDVAALVAETVEAGRKGQFVEKNTVRLVERYQWPLAFAFWCLLVSLCYEFPVRPKPRDIRLAPDETGKRIPETGKLAAANTTTMAAMLLVCLVALPLPPSAFAAATLAHPPAAAPEPAPLAKIVGRLANAPTHSARDWAELAQETTRWGSRLQSEQHPVPEGPVHDALKAVDLGAKLDAKAADWPKLREELQALLKKEDEEKKDDQEKENQEQQPDQDQQQKDKQGKKQEQRDKDGKNKDSKKENDPAEKNEQSSGEQPEKGEDKKDPGESAFGDMNKKEELPPPPSEDTQKVGGAPEKKEEQQAVDPSLALPLQKLDQLRNQDSPAQLFQLMEGERKQGPKKPGKDW